jgi:hypothetical protein
VGTMGYTNQICRLFLQGQCNMGWRCRHIHLIPPTVNSSSGSTENKVAVKVPQLAQVRSDVEREPFIKVLGDSYSNVAVSEKWTYNPDPSICLDEKNVPQILAKWGYETDGSAWLDEPELPRWGCETNASIWLDTRSDSSEASSSSSGSNSTLAYSDSFPVKRPRPRNSETCWRWLKGTCERGYNCSFVHGDLEYDDPPTVSLC